MSAIYEEHKFVPLLVECLAITDSVTKGRRQLPVRELFGREHIRAGRMD